MPGGQKRTSLSMQRKLPELRSSTKNLQRLEDSLDFVSCGLRVQLKAIRVLLFLDFTAAYSVRLAFDVLFLAICCVAIILDRPVTLDSFSVAIIAELVYIAFMLLETTVRWCAENTLFLRHLSTRIDFAAVILIVVCFIVGVFVHSAGKSRMSKENTVLVDMHPTLTHSYPRYATSNTNPPSLLPTC